MGMPNHLVLVRHGESEGNVANLAEKSGDDSLFTDEFRERPGHEWHLTERGVEQISAAGLWIANFILDAYPDLNDGFDLYYTSVHLRARESAAHLSIPDADWRGEIRIRERDWGDIESMPRAEFEQKYPDSALKKRRDPLYWRPPGGQSIADVADVRVESMNRTLHLQHDEKGRNSAILSTHGEYIWATHLKLERMGHIDWAMAEQDASRKIKNAQVVHFTRLNPESGEQAPDLGWVRSVTPWETPDSPGTWRYVEQKRYSNAELLEQAARVPRIFE